MARFRNHWRTSGFAAFHALLRHLAATPRLSPLSEIEQPISVPDAEAKPKGGHAAKSSGIEVG